MSIESPDNVEGFERKEGENKYKPIEILRQRENPTQFITDVDGKLMMVDPDLKSINDYIFQEIKPGSVLSLGSGLANPYRMLPAMEKISQITSLDISRKNNQVNRELIEGSQGMGTQEFVEPTDLEVLHNLAESIANDKDYGIKSNGQELLRMLYEKSQYQGKMDIITADMIEQMDQLGSGELVDNRKYDNILLLFSLFTRDKEETTRLIMNMKARLNEGGRVIVMDVWEWDGVSESTDDNYILSEDEVVSQKYNEAWTWDAESLGELFEDVGLELTRKEEKEVEESDEVKEEFGGYTYMTFSERDLSNVESVE